MRVLLAGNKNFSRHKHKIEEWFQLFDLIAYSNYMFKGDMLYY